MIPALRARPLTASDGEAYVRRSTDHIVEAALERHENVLLSVARGAGATSLLYRLESVLADVVYLNAEFAESGSEVLDSLASRLGAIPAQSGPGPGHSGSDPLGPPPSFGRVSDVLRTGERSPIALVDGPVAPRVAFDLFGRWRNELLTLPLAWLVVAHVDALAEYLTPPADVFFDLVAELEPLSKNEALEVLARRDALGTLSAEARRAVVDTFDGTPRHLIQLARPQMGRDARGWVERIEAHNQLASNLSRGARSLLAEMQGRGIVAATDNDLQRRLGVTARQLRRNLEELRKSGLAEIVPGGGGKPGRPPTNYRLTRLGTAGVP